ncbi:MAG: hypothetical protein WBP56_04520 [Polyangia bacterium]
MTPPLTVQAYVTCFPPGQEAQVRQFQRGDFILTHSNSLLAWLIRLGQSLRYWGENRKYTRWSHAAIIVSDDGQLIEALAEGVVKTRLSDYKPTEYHLVHLDGSIANARDREQAVEFAEHSCHKGYGWTTLVSIGLNLITGWKFTFCVDGQFICSELVARCLERTSVIFNHIPQHISPAELAKHFQVQPPPAGTAKGDPPPQRWLPRLSWR